MLIVHTARNHAYLGIGPKVVKTKSRDLVFTTFGPIPRYAWFRAVWTMSITAPQLGEDKRNILFSLWLSHNHAWQFSLIRAPAPW